MAHLVIARKYRPQKFADVVGQEHITRTLRNAILQGRVGHAYLFVGSRGIGKTTTARIFAKALNCMKPDGAEPCCQCRSCLEIAAGNSLDVLEIDAASHTGVDNIRDIRDNVQFTPSYSQYKIYIIDEAHMLSKAAWNALLKTLEEPPPHVKFLFATTEPHKMLDTILSRCQRLDLKRIPAALIAGRLREIADTEKVAIADGALAAIARAADGGMRDAQSIFDQMISFCGGRESSEAISEPEVLGVFGLASGAELKSITQALLANDLAAIVLLLQELADRGHDLEHLLGDLILFARNLLVCQVCQRPETAVDASAGELAELVAMGRATEPGMLQRLLEALMAQESFVRYALNKRIALEVALVRALRETHSVAIDDVLARLVDWQRRGGPSLPPTPAPAAASTPAEKPIPPPASSAPTPTRTVATPPAPASPAPATADTPPLAVRAESATPVVAEAKPLSPAPATADTPPLAVRAESAKPVVAEAKPLSPAPPRPPAPAPVTPTPAASAPPPADVEPVPAELWEKLCAGIEKLPKRQTLATALRKLRPVSFRNGVLMVAYDAQMPPAQVERLNSAEILGLLQECCQRVLALADARVVFKQWVDDVSGGQKKSLLSSPEIRERAARDPFVQEVCQLFGGKVIDARG